MVRKETYLKNIEANLKKLDAEIEILKAKAAKAKAEAKAKYNKTIEKLLNKKKTTREKLYDKMEAQLKIWDAEIKILKAKAAKAKLEAKPKYDEMIDLLHAKQKEAQEKLQELKKASDKAWKDIKKGSEKAWDEMKKALDTAVSKFK